MDVHYLPRNLNKPTPYYLHDEMTYRHDLMQTASIESYSPETIFTYIYISTSPYFSTSASIEVLPW